MIYTFNNEEIVDVVMFKKILPTDIRSTFQLIQKYAGLLNAPPDSVLYHKTLVFLKHLRYRYYVYSFDLSPVAKQYCLAYEKAFPELKVEATLELPCPPPTIEWDDVDLEEVDDDGTLLPDECIEDVEPDSFSKVELEKCESTDSVKTTQILANRVELEQKDPAFIAYQNKIEKNKAIVKRSLRLLDARRTNHEPETDCAQRSTNPPDKANTDRKPKKRKVMCSPSFGMQLIRAVYGVPVTYAAKGCRVARKLLGLPDDCEAHLYVDRSGIYYACGGVDEIDSVRAISLPDREYFGNNAYAYKGGETTKLLMLCDEPLSGNNRHLINTTHSEVLGWEKQEDDLLHWINHLRRDGHSQIT